MSISLILLLIPLPYQLNLAARPKLSLTFTPLILMGQPDFACVIDFFRYILKIVAAHNSEHNAHRFAPEVNASHGKWDDAWLAHAGRSYVSSGLYFLAFDQGAPAWSVTSNRRWFIVQDLEQSRKTWLFWCPPGSCSLRVIPDILNPARVTVAGRIFRVILAFHLNVTLTKPVTA